MEGNVKEIGDGLYNFQAVLEQEGSNLEEFIRSNYTDKWLSDEMYCVSAIRTTFVNAMTGFLIDEGLFNLERINLSIITDPLAHDIEHTPAIPYKGYKYLTTHSMIYSKFLACANKKIKGIFVDSPNIRLELASPVGEQRGKYLIDFSQLDIELRRNRNVTQDDYYHKTDSVLEILNEDMTIIKDFFERMIIRAIEAVNKKNQEHIKTLGVVIEVPSRGFPSYNKEEAVKKYGARHFEEKLGEETKSQFFWITGLIRENYDLIYPYLNADGSRVELDKAKSANIFNYDIVAKSIDAGTGKHSPAREILSGAIREWLYEPIIRRILDNKVLPREPVFKNGNIVNINELGGYGPFLQFANMKDKAGNALFPDTMGGGVGIERTLFTLLKGEKIKKIEDVTYFGKNPDSHPLYLY